MMKTIFNSFIKKLDINLFNEIKKTITEEIYNYNSTSQLLLDDDYFLYIFSTAFFNYCGVEIKKIPFVIEQMGSDYIPNIPFNDFIKIHNKSINLILEYLKEYNDI